MKKIIFLLLAAFLSQHSFSQPFIDYNFNSGNGIVNITGFSPKAIARSGKIIIVAGIFNSGDVKVYFYNEEGSPVTAMGSGGSTTIALAATNLSVTGVALDPISKRIYISGTRYLIGVIDGFVIALNPLGNLNTSFSGDGYLDFSAMPGSQNINTIGVQSTGRIIVAGDSSNKYMVAGFLPTGVLDNTFSGDGIYIQPNINPTTPVLGSIKKLDINDVDEIYTAGSASTNATYGLILKSDGTLQKIYPQFLSYYAIAGIKYFNGKIIVASGYQFSTPSTIRVSCFLPDGTYDPNFNSTGTFTTSTGYSDYLTGLDIDHEGRIVASGYSNTGASAFYYQYSILRISIKGVLDPTIGYSILASSPANSSNASILTSDGRLIIAGSTSGASAAGNLIKVNLKEVHSPTLPLFTAVKYLGSDPFALPDYSNPDYEIIYTSNDPSKAILSSRRIVTIRDTGIVGIRLRIPEDSFYYAMDTIDYLKIEAKPPAIILGNKIITEGVGSVETYRISPDTLMGYWSLDEIYAADPANYNIFPSTDSPEVDIYFNKDFSGGKLKYTFWDNSQIPYVIEKNIKPGSSSAQANLLDSLICPIELVSCAGNYIDQFRINTLFNDSSGCGMGGYNDFTKTDITTTLFLGEPYTALFRLNKTATQSRFVAVWLDHNNDGNFTNEDFLGVDFSDKSEIKIPKIIIKNDPSYAGPRRLRIRCITNATFNQNDACQSGNEAGETEDYLVTLQEKDALQGPNVVTPNEDGKNDYLVIRGVDGKKTNKLVVFDRLGDVKFEKENYNNDWDGKKTDGDMLNKGTYYYIFSNGNNQVKGFFELLY